MRAILFIIGVVLSIQVSCQNRVDQRKLTFLLKTENTRLCLDCIFEDCEAFMINTHLFTRLRELEVQNLGYDISMKGLQFLPELRSLILLNSGGVSKKSQINYLGSLTKLEHLSFYADHQDPHYRAINRSITNTLVSKVDFGRLKKLRYLRLENHLDPKKLIRELNELKHLDTLILTRSRFDVLDCAELTLDSLTYLEVHDFLLHPRIANAQQVANRKTIRMDYRWRERPYYRKYRSELGNAIIPIYAYNPLSFYKNVSYPKRLKVATLKLPKAVYNVASYDRGRDILGNSIFYQTQFIPSQNFYYDFYHNAIGLRNIYGWMSKLSENINADSLATSDSSIVVENQYFGTLKEGGTAFRALSMAYAYPELYSIHDHFEKWDTTAIERRQESLKYANGTIPKILWSTSKAPAYFKKGKMRKMERYYHQFYEIKKARTYNNGMIYQLQPVRKWEVKEELLAKERRNENLRDINTIRSLGFIPVELKSDEFKELSKLNIMDFWLEYDSGSAEAMLNLKTILGIKHIAIEWKTLNGDSIRRNMDRAYSSYERAENRNNAYMRVYGKRTFEKMKRIERDLNRMKRGFGNEENCSKKLLYYRNASSIEMDMSQDSWLSYANKVKQHEKEALLNTDLSAILKSDKWAHPFELNDIANKTSFAWRQQYDSISLSYFSIANSHNTNASITSILLFDMKKKTMVKYKYDLGLDPLNVNNSRVSLRTNDGQVIPESDTINTVYRGLSLPMKGLNQQRVLVFYNNGDLALIRNLVPAEGNVLRGEIIPQDLITLRAFLEMLK